MIRRRRSGFDDYQRQQIRELASDLPGHERFVEDLFMAIATGDVGRLEAVLEGIGDPSDSSCPVVFANRNVRWSLAAATCCAMPVGNLPVWKRTRSSLWQAAARAPAGPLARIEALLARMDEIDDDAGLPEN